MKPNEEKSPVDAYFRQHEADIPVVYDAEHWHQLADRLDAAAAPPLPAAGPKKAARARSRKGWWVTGVLLLALLALRWSRPAEEETVQTPELLPGSDSVLTNMRIETEPAPPAPLPAGRVNDGVAREKRPAAVSGVDDGPEAPAGLPAAEDPAPVLAPAMPAPADTSGIAPKPAKKKKHLFW